MEISSRVAVCRSSVSRETVGDMALSAMTFKGNRCISLSGDTIQLAVSDQDTHLVDRESMSAKTEWKEGVGTEEWIAQRKTGLCHSWRT